MTERRKILRVIAAATLAFALALAAALGGAAAWRRSLPGRIESALEKGNTAKAERLIGRLADGEEKTEYENRCRLLEADALLESGDFSGAAALYASLGGFEGAEEGCREALYRLAGQELESGDFESARRRFESLGAYRDAARQALRAQLGTARAMESEGRLGEAFLLACRLDGLDEAREYALELAEKICGRRDLEAALSAVRNLSPEELRLRRELREKREALPRGIVDVGFYHTVALRSDGTVLACGDDGFGQCEVGQWRGATAVCAGAYHTAALFADGTVAAVGRNDEGQCEVGQWRDIVAIAAADYATFGLKADGTVVACGFNDYYMLRDWTRIARISGGSYNLAALRENGEALISHESARSEELTDLVDLAVNTGYAVGLREDGAAVCAAADLSAWHDLVAVSASANAILGLDARGEVYAHFFRAGMGEDFAAPGDVVAMAAGGTHCAFVRADGTVAVWGENAHGECDAAGWDLF